MAEMEVAYREPKTNGKSSVLLPDEPFVTNHLENDLLKIRINRMVRAAKDIASSQWAVPLLLTIILGYWIYSDQKSTNLISTKDEQIEDLKQDIKEQNKILVRLETLKEVEEKQKVIEQQKREDERVLDATYREKINKDFNELKLVVENRLGIKSN